MQRSNFFPRWVGLRIGGEIAHFHVGGRRKLLCILSRRNHQKFLRRKQPCVLSRHQRNISVSARQQNNLLGAFSWERSETRAPLISGVKLVKKYLFDLPRREATE